MSLMQQAFRTYRKECAGIVEAEKLEPLAPVSHAVTTASIEITIDIDGNFVNSKEIDEKTLFPVTEKSLGRTGKAIFPHPLCERLVFLIPENKEKYNKYIEQISYRTSRIS